MSKSLATPEFDRFLEHPRWLLEAPLVPVQGVRFQPAGFPDMGPAVFSDPDGVDRLLVESAQSMANHLEATVWDRARGALRSPLEGLSHVRLVDETGQLLTSSWLEAHRLGSTRLLTTGGLGDRISKRTNGPTQGPPDPRRLPKLLFELDAGSLVHGVFLQSLGGSLRVPRLLGAFIEAIDVRPAVSGGVKLDPLEPDAPPSSGRGQVIFHREEFVAGRIRLFANLDLAQLRGYGLPPNETRLVLALALYELRSLLDAPLRLRSRCDLRLAGELEVTPKELHLPSQGELEGCLPQLVQACPQMELTELVAGPP